LRLQEQGDLEGAARASLRGQAAEARARAQEDASLLYRDPRYSPRAPGEPPNLEAYLTDLTAESETLLQQQNAAADDYQRWNRKADAYVGVLTLLATALFLLGLSQALLGRLRLFFALVGTFAAGSGVLWAAGILILP
jgi:regulator of protease activity HflC (stomatin/prohibitin superfamily)